MQVIGWCDVQNLETETLSEQNGAFFLGGEMLSAEYVGNNLACHKFSFLSGPSL